MKLYPITYITVSLRLVLLKASGSGIFKWYNAYSVYDKVVRPRFSSGHPYTDVNEHSVKSDQKFGT